MGQGICDCVVIRNVLLSTTDVLLVFRHSAGTITYAATRDLKVAQEHLVHSRISTTSDIYVHLDSEIAEEATEALASLIIPGGSITVQESGKIQ